MNKSLSYPLSSQLFGLIQKLQELRLEKLDPEISEKLDRVQELLGDLCVTTHRGIRMIAADYNFLSRDHVFFDGDNDHSGAV